MENNNLKNNIKYSYVLWEHDIHNNLDEALHHKDYEVVINYVDKKDIDRLDLNNLHKYLNSDTRTLSRVEYLKSIK